MKEITRRIVGLLLDNKLQNILEQQIRDENQTTLELGEKIVASPRKLKQDVSDMKDEYARLTAECRTLTLQATDLQAQNVTVKQTAAVEMNRGSNSQRLEGILQKLEESQRILESRDQLNQQLEEIKNRIRALKKELEDGLIEQKVRNEMDNKRQKYELQLRREEEEVEELRKRVVTSSKSSSTLLESLRSEIHALEDSVASLREEKTVWEKRLEEMDAEVCERGGDELQKKQRVSESRGQLEKRITMMEELLRRVKSYQEVMIQSVTFYICFFNYLFVEGLV